MTGRRASSVLICVGIETDCEDVSVGVSSPDERRGDVSANGDVLTLQFHKGLQCHL